MQAKRAHKKQGKHLGHHLLGTYGTLVLTVVSVGALAGSVLLSHAYLGSGSLAAVISSNLVNLANTERTQEDLGALTVNPKLTAAAQAKADDMAAKGYFAHTSPDGKTSWYWFEQAGYAFSYAGENLAVDFSDSDAVENAWMNSPTHRENILNEHYTEIGIATAKGIYGGHHTTFVVQMFGTPAGAADTGAVAVNPPPTAFPSPLALVAAAPVAALRDLYLVVGGIVLGALVSITGPDFKKYRRRYLAAAAFLIVLMGGLYFAADHFIFTSPTLTAAAATSGQ